MNPWDHLTKNRRRSKAVLAGRGFLEEKENRGARTGKECWGREPLRQRAALGGRRGGHEEKARGGG